MNVVPSLLDKLFNIRPLKLCNTKISFVGLSPPRESAKLNLNVYERK